VTAFVADTHSLVWYLGSPDRLGPLARRAFAEANAGRARIYVPVIVLAEIIFIVERGKIHADVQGIVRQLGTLPAFSILPLRLATIQRLPALNSVPEMHDRLIVAEALAHKASVITRDRAITEAGVVPTVW
jgi:PIN domain nuclease of toxin-antitoxin system